MITSWPQYRGPVMPTAGLSSVLCHSTAAAFSQHQYLFSTWTKGQIITEGIQCRIHHHGFILQSLQKTYCSIKTGLQSFWKGWYPKLLSFPTACTHVYCTITQACTRSPSSLCLASLMHSPILHVFPHPFCLPHFSPSLTHSDRFPPFI